MWIDRCTGSQFVSKVTVYMLKDDDMQSVIALVLDNVMIEV